MVERKDRTAYRSHRVTVVTTSLSDVKPSPLCEEKTPGFEPPTGNKLPNLPSRRQLLSERS